MPKGEGNRSVRFPSPLGTPHLSTDRGSPPHGKRAVSYVFECVKLVRAQLAVKSQGRGNYAGVIDSVSPRRFSDGGEPRSVER